MSITAERKTALMKEYATKPNDTGSPEVQIALLTDRITQLLLPFAHAKTRRSLYYHRRSCLDRVCTSGGAASTVRTSQESPHARGLRPVESPRCNATVARRQMVRIHLDAERRRFKWPSRGDVRVAVAGDADDDELALVAMRIENACGV